MSRYPASQGSHSPRLSLCGTRFKCFADAVKLSAAASEYASIAERLERMCGDGSLNDYTRRAILRMTAAALDGIAAGYPAVRKGVGGTLGGKVLDYEEKRIYMRGRAEGKAEGRAETLRSTACSMMAGGFVL